MYFTSLQVIQGRVVTPLAFAGQKGDKVHAAVVSSTLEGKGNQYIIYYTYISS